MLLDVMDGPFEKAAFNLTAVVGEEALSDLFVFHLTVSSRDATLTALGHHEIEDGLIGRTVSIKMHDADTLRYGIIASVELAPRRDDDSGIIARLVMRPRVHLATLRKNTRIFQNKYVHEIVGAVLAESGIQYRYLLSNNYQKRIYCTQYEETDYAFVTRILAEEGIYWFFEHVTSFTPEEAPKVEDDSSKVGAVATVIGKVLGGVAPLAESNAIAGGVIGTAGSLASIVGDAATAFVDPEPDDPIKGASGSGGPTSKTPVDVFAFGDSVDGYLTTQVDDGSLVVRYEPKSKLFASDNVLSLAGVRTIGSQAVEIRDYNFRRPMALLSKREATPEPGLATVPIDVLGLMKAAEVYEHHGEYEKPDIDEAEAKIRLEQLRAPTAIVKGESTCPRMMPGFGLHLSLAPAPFADGRFIPVKVSHEAFNVALGSADARREIDADSRGSEAPKVMEAVAALLRDLEGKRRRLAEGELRELSAAALAGAGSSPRIYQNRFEWVAKDVVFRPPLPPRIRHAVNETAVVVGPAGQAVYADNYGRVKVQFHWDRENEYNEASSCWIRVQSTWAGAGYGFQFFPRVGMEVVVTFLGGDPDRPVISGSLYNATHPTPEPLPQRLTRSGLRSQTVPGGGGFNELSFEDAKGIERVFLHAQKDLHEVVNDAHTTTVRGHQTTNVGGAQKVGVQAEQIHAVGTHATTITGKNHTTHVGGDQVERVAKNKSELIHGDSVKEVRGVSMTESVSDDLKVVRGNMAVIVEGKHQTHVIPKGDKLGGMTKYVDGSIDYMATKFITLCAQNTDQTATEHQGIGFQCGDTYITLGKDKITLHAKNIEIDGTDEVLLKSKKIRLEGSEEVSLGKAASTAKLDADGWSITGVSKVEMKTKGSAIVIDEMVIEVSGTSQVAVKGGQVKLGSGQAQDSQTTSSSSTSDKPKTVHLKIAFCHPEGTNDTAPIASTKYRLVSGNRAWEGTTDGEGGIDIELPPGMQAGVIFLFVEQHETYKKRYASPLAFQLQVTDDFGAASDVAGARLRLRNLGFSPGTDLTVTDMEKDPLLVQAIEAFQREKQIRVSGKLEDDDTAKTLDTMFGEAK